MHVYLRTRQKIKAERRTDKQRETDIHYRKLTNLYIFTVRNVVNKFLTYSASTNITANRHIISVIHVFNRNSSFSLSSTAL